MIINSGISCGRFGNTFIRNLLTIALSNKFNISAIYEDSYTNELIHWVYQQTLIRMICQMILVVNGEKKLRKS